MKVRPIVNESTLDCPMCGASTGNAHRERDCFSMIQWASNVPDRDHGNLIRQRDRIREAERLIAAAVQIMTPEQVGQWKGVRLWQEMDW